MIKFSLKAFRKSMAWRVEDTRREVLYVSRVAGVVGKGERAEDIVVKIISAQI
jgi:hypothetical protein